MKLPATADLIEGAGFLAECALIVVVCRRSLWKTLPVFAFLCVFTPVEDSVLIAINRTATKTTYFWAFWSFAIADYGVQLTLVAEIARRILRPAGEWIGGARQEFVCYSAIGAAIALFFVVRFVPHSEDAHELLYMRASLFTSLLICLCFLALTAIANRLRVPRRSHIKAVVDGLAIWNIACIADDIALTTGISPHTVLTLDYARMLTWDVVLVYWASALLRREATRHDLSEILPIVLPMRHDNDATAPPRK